MHKLVGRPPGPDLLRGVWTYEPPHDAVGLRTLPLWPISLPIRYTSCESNLTVHIGGAAFWACSTQFINSSYLDALECIPDALMMPAYIVDKVNENGVLGAPGTCLQISAHHYDYYGAQREDFTADIIDASSRPPVKHGLISSVHPDPTYSMAAAAALVGLPLVDGNWMGADSVRHSDTSAFPTLLRTLSDMRGTLGGVLDLLPDRFAVLSDDSPGSGLQNDLLRRAVAAKGQTILKHAVVPAFSSKHPERTREPVDEYVRSLHDEGIRYLLLAAGPMVQPLLACAIHRWGASPRLLQVVVLGASSSGEISAFIAEPHCTKDEIYAVCENGGWIGVQACTASTYAEDDLIVTKQQAVGCRHTSPKASMACRGQRRRVYTSNRVTHATMTRWPRTLQDYSASCFARHPARS